MEEWEEQRLGVKAQLLGLALSDPAPPTAASQLWVLIEGPMSSDSLPSGAFAPSLTGAPQALLCPLETILTSLVAQWRSPPANAGDVGLIPGSGRSPGRGNGNPLQYSCLGNPSTEESGGLQSVGPQRSDMTEHTRETVTPLSPHVLPCPPTTLLRASPSSLSAAGPPASFAGFPRPFSEPPLWLGSHSAPLPLCPPGLPGAPRGPSL